MFIANSICIIATVTKTATSLLESTRFLFFLFILLKAAELRLFNKTKMTVPIGKIA